MSIAKSFLAIGISIMFVLFIGYAVFIFYEPPKKLQLEDTNCLMEYNCTKYFPTKENLSLRKETLPDKRVSECWNKQQDCLDSAREFSPRFKNKRISFFILILIGLSAIILGIFLSRMEGIGSGFIGGGILTMIWVLIYTQEYWTSISRYFKLFVLGLTLFLMIFLGYKRMEKKKVLNK
jgi:hypothetical protein